jgi:hypothetical protein
MATKSKTTKRELGSVPQGEHDLVSGRKANGPGDAPAVKISTKTVKAAATNDTRPLKGRSHLPRHTKRWGLYGLSASTENPKIR